MTNVYDTADFHLFYPAPQADLNDCCETPRTLDVQTIQHLSINSLVQLIEAKRQPTTNKRILKKRKQVRFDVAITFGRTPSRSRQTTTIIDCTRNIRKSNTHNDTVRPTD